MHDIETSLRLGDTSMIRPRTIHTDRQQFNQNMHCIGDGS
jgi:hypothetical protein